MTDCTFQILPPLVEDEFDAQHEEIIDGLYRQKSCDELGIFCPDAEESLKVFRDNHGG